MLVALVFPAALVRTPGKFLDPRRWFWMALYLPVLFYYIIRANLEVAYLVLHPAMPIRPGIVRVRTALKTDTARTALANCITEKGIVNTHDWDMTCTRPEQMLQIHEKELLLCKACGEIIGAVDHILWVARRLGHLAYANPTLMLVALSKGKLADVEPPAGIESTDQLLRGDRIRILCPRCRQVTSLRA